MAKHSFLLLCVPFILASTISLVCDANDENRKPHIVYMGSLPKGAYSPTSHHLSMLQQVIDGSDAANHIIRSYRRSFKGFAAMLTDQQIEKLTNMEGVISVFPSKTLQLQTTRSWDFMGLKESIKRNQTAESDVIIGLIDTGIWPESDSFNDEGFGPVPKKWKGTCAGGKNFTCNNKIIGARHYDSLGYGDSESARDVIGHGSHTASIAAGNKVEGVSFYGLAQGTARGGVPSARIAVYNVCRSFGGCDDADVLAAFDDSIADGVDIISIQMGGTNAMDFYTDTIAIGSFHAMEKGILTVHSAGNAGPKLGTISSVAPWLLSVAASNTDRQIVDKVVLGNGKTLNGKSVNTFVSNGTKFPIAVQNADPTHCPKGMSPENCECLDSDLVKGKVVLCPEGLGELRAYDEGAVASITKMEIGAPRVTFFPALDLDPKDYALVKSYTNSTNYPQAEILKSTEIFDHNAPKVASFSSRGPNSLVVEILKPDVTAPGVEILAAYTLAQSASGHFSDTRMVKYSILSGTSMSSPHVAGIAAYVKTFHPDWSPAAIKSAIMTTAKPIIGTYNQTGEFAYGSGHVNPQAAIDPGLVYDISKEDYVQMLCNYGFNSEKMKMVTGENTTCLGSSSRSLVKDLNYPALVIQVEPLKPIHVKINRTVTNVGFANSTYKATFMPNSEVRISELLTTLKISVEPEILSFKSLNEKQSFVVTVAGVKPKEFMFRELLVWSDGTHSVRSPIIVL